MGIKKTMFDRVSVESSCNSYPLFSFAVSAVGTRIGRRTSSRRATSDAGGAWLSEAGESGQLTEQEREKEKHESRTSSFSPLFFFFLCFFRDTVAIPWNVTLRYSRLYFFESKKAFFEDSDASSPRLEKIVEKRQRNGKRNIPPYDCCPAFSSSPLLSSRPILRRRKLIRCCCFSSYYYY